MEPNKRRRIDSEQLENLVAQGENDKLKSIIQNSNGSNLTDSFGVNLLDLAVKYNNVDLLKFLLTLDFDVNAKVSSGSIPLLLAASNDNFEAMQILLDSNADVCVGNSIGKSAFEILLDRKETVSEDLINKCLQKFNMSIADVGKKAEILVRTNCSLKLVLSLKDSLVTQTVLECKNTIDSHESEEAINFAMKSLDVDNVRALLHHGPGTLIRKKKFMDNLDIMSRGRHPNLKVFETFLRVLINFDILDHGNIDKFRRICMFGNKEAVRLLLQYRIDTHLRNTFEYHMVPGIFYNKRVDAIKLLKDKQFDVNGKIHLALGDAAWTALELSIRGKNSIKTIQYLLDLGIDLNIKSHNGSTPIIMYQVWTIKCLGKILLQHGADIQAVDNDQRTIFEVAPYTQILNTVLPQLSIVEAQGTTILQHFRDKAELYKREYDDYCKQVAGFKEHEIAESVTLFTILTEKTENLARLLRDKDAIPLVNEYCCENKIHSYFVSMLKMKLERASKVYLSKCNLVMLVSVYSGPAVGIDHLVVEQIFSFLTYRDMIALAHLKK